MVCLQILCCEVRRSYYSLHSKMIVGLPLRNLLQDGRGFRCNIMNYRPLYILPRISNPTIILERREYILDLLNREDHNLRGSYTVWSFFHNILFKMAVISLQLLCLRTAFWQQMLWMHKDCSVKLKRLQRPLSCNRCRNRSSRWTKCPYRHWFQ